MNTTLEDRKLAQQGRERRESSAGGAIQFLRQEIVNEQSPLLSALANIAVVVGFAAFAFTVKYVLKNLSYD